MLRKLVKFDSPITVLSHERLRVDMTYHSDGEVTLNSVEILQPWQLAWRDAIAPKFSTQELAILRKAVVENEPALIQGTTVQPSPHLHPNSSIQGCCGLAFPRWKSQGFTSTWDVSEDFYKLTNLIDSCAKAVVDVEDDLVDPTEVFISWFDGTERQKMLSELLLEINRELAKRDSNG